jgi:hypothetical protein
MSAKDFFIHEKTFTLRVEKFHRVLNHPEESII